MSRAKTNQRGGSEIHQGAVMKKEWVTRRLGDVVTRLTNGFVGPTRNIYHESGVPYLLARHVRNNQLAFDGRTFVSDEFNRKNKKSMLKAGDVLLVQSGHIGHSAVVSKEHEGHNCHAMIVITPVEKVMTGPFLSLFFNSPDMQQGFEAIRSGSTVPHLTCGAVKELQIPIPPLAEQQRIVGLLDEAFEGIATAKANAEKNLKNARALFESHLQSVFSQRGKGWVEKRLADVCTFSSGGTPSKSKNSYWNGEIPWISGRDMKSTQLFDSHLHISQSAVDESSTRMAPAGTLLILVRGMGLAHGAQIGELMVPCAFNQDIRGIHPEPSMVPRYLVFALRHGINLSDTVLSNAAHGTLKIDSNELHKVIISIPPRDQQEKIVKTIDSLATETQRLATLYTRKLAALEALKKSLLHQAFSGEL